MYFITATLACLAYAGLVSATLTCQKQASSDNPTPNVLAIYTPSQNQVVPVDRPFTITWENTTGISSVSIVLLQGPSTNVVPIECIVDNAPNTGNYIWTPSPDLEPTGNSGYGLKIIDDNTGEFQYSTQFGISNPNVQSSASSSPTGGSTAAQISDGQVQVPTGSTSGTVIATSHHVKATATHTKSQYAVSSSKAYYPSSVLVGASSGFPSHTKNGTHLSTKHHTAKTYASTGAPQNSTQFVTPTGPLTVPSSLAPVTSVAIATASTPVSVVPSGTTAATKSTTGAAVRVAAGGMLAGLGGMAALLL